MQHMCRQQEYLACPDRNVSDNSLFDHLQHHVSTHLVKELVSWVIVEIDPLVGSTYDLDDHAALVKERFVPDRWLKSILVHVYPALEIKRKLHLYLPDALLRL